MIVIKSCPHCKRKLDWGPNSRGIGVPVKACPHCEGVIVDKDLNEWELKPLLSKLSYYFVLFWTAICFGFIGPIVVIGIDMFGGIKVPGSTYFFSYVVGIILVSVYLLFKHMKDIRDSKIRMQDTAYRALLQRAGLLKQ